MIVVANNLPYSNVGEEDFRESLRSTLAFSARDWAGERDTAWIWGIVFGWDGDPEDEIEDCWAEMAERFGWDEANVARLQRLHAQFQEWR